VIGVGIINNFVLVGVGVKTMTSFVTFGESVDFYNVTCSTVKGIYEGKPEEISRYAHRTLWECPISLS
jgi:hypothetical protein